MEDKIKQKILKDIEEWKLKCYPNPPDRHFNLIIWKELQAKLNQHEETKNSIIKNISEFNEKKYGHCKDSCESQEYDAINNLIKELNGAYLKPKTK